MVDKKRTKFFLNLPGSDEVLTGSITFYDQKDEACKSENYGEWIEYLNDDIEMLKKTFHIADVFCEGMNRESLESKCKDLGLDNLGKEVVFNFMVLNEMRRMISEIDKRFEIELKKHQLSREEIKGLYDDIKGSTGVSYIALRNIMLLFISLHSKEIVSGTKQKRNLKKGEINRQKSNQERKVVATEKQLLCVNAWEEARKKNPNIKISEFIMRNSHKLPYSQKMITRDLMKWVRLYKKV